MNDKALGGIVIAIFLLIVLQAANMLTVNDSNRRIKAIEVANVGLQAAVAANARTMERLGR